MLFMLHNRLHRDRAFGLFLGLVPGIATARAALDPSRRRAVVLQARLQQSPHG
jgi:hypothetical protein